MGQEKQEASNGMKNLQKAADTLSTMLVQEIKGLNVRQRAARKEKSTDTGLMKELKEATAVLKDLTGVTKTLNDQGMSGNAAWCCCRRWRRHDGRKQGEEHRLEAPAEAAGIYAAA